MNEQFFLDGIEEYLERNNFKKSEMEIQIIKIYNFEKYKNLKRPAETLSSSQNLKDFQKEQELYCNYLNYFKIFKD